MYVEPKDGSVDWDSVIAAVVETRASTLQMREYDIKFVPPAIEMCASLRTLELSYNKLTSLPVEIGSLVALEELYLDHNHLVALPDTLGRLTNLRVLNIQANCLEFVPASLMRLPSLSHAKVLLNAFDFRERAVVPLGTDAVPTLVNLCCWSLLEAGVEAGTLPEDLQERLQRCVSCVVCSKPCVVGFATGQTHLLVQRHRVLVRVEVCSLECAAVVHAREPDEEAVQLQDHMVEAIQRSNRWFQAMTAEIRNIQ